jgi:hypothetical protein
MKVNPFYYSWQFLLGRTADHGNAGPFVAWLLTLGFLALIAASIWIAGTNWREGPSPCPTHPLPSFELQGCPPPALLTWQSVEPFVRSK